MSTTCTRFWETPSYTSCERSFNPMVCTALSRNKIFGTCPCINVRCFLCSSFASRSGSNHIRIGKNSFKKITSSTVDASNGGRIRRRWSWGKVQSYERWLMHETWDTRKETPVKLTRSALIHQWNGDLLSEMSPRQTRSRSAHLVVLLYIYKNNICCIRPVSQRIRTLLINVYVHIT